MIVALNTGTRAVQQPIALEGGRICGFMPYLTSWSRDGLPVDLINAADETFTADLEPTRITTFVSM